MNGIDLTLIIKRNWDIPVIVMTGYKPDVQKFAAMEVGASLFLAKPFNFGVVKATINQVPSRSARRAETAVSSSR